MMDIELTQTCFLNTIKVPEGDTLISCSKDGSRLDIRKYLFGEE